MEEKVLAAIEGTVRAVVFQNPENGYTVLRLGVGEETVTCVGTLPGVAPGEGLRLYGGWTSHAAYGQQFKAEHAERFLPEGSAAIYDYLASGAIRGVGAKMARLIVEAFGARSLDVIENSPEELAGIRGITEKKAAAISQRFREQTGMRRLMEFLVDNGVKPVAAVRLWRLYGDEAESEIIRNPYLLAGEELGLDFFTADALARKLGFAADASERVRAAIVFELRHNEGNGHVFLPGDKLCAAAAQLLEIDPDPVERTAEDMIALGELVSERVTTVEAVYMRDMYEAEESVAGRILRMVRTPVDQIPGLKALVERCERACGLRFADKQRMALELAASGRVTVLTGGPGTGKTTTVRGILELYDRMGLATLLTAPTGRAAKRLSELTGREAQTVHRLLGAGMPEAGEREFEKCAADPLECDAVILDETSMVDIKLMAALLDAMPPDCRLVLVGDADQLPSVGPGNVFGDIIRSGVAPVVALTDIFRQAKCSDIVKNAHSINSGQVPPLKNEGGDFFFLKRTEAESITATVTELVSRRLPQNMGIPAREIQILSPSRKYGGGTWALNLAVQEALNPAAPGKKEKTVGPVTFRVGDRVMQTRNNYDIMWTRQPPEAPPKAGGSGGRGQGEPGLPHSGGDGWPDGPGGGGDGEGSGPREPGYGIYNGDVGYIEDMDEGAQVAAIRFDERLVLYPFDSMTELELAYAVTVHKAQGSEYRAVVLALPRCPPGLVTRSVLYTAVTRARELLVVAGGPDVFSAMVANDRRARRYSGLRARLCGEVG